MLSSGDAIFPDLVQLLIVLEREDAPVWRRVRVRVHAARRTHRVIQGVMGWGNRLPHRFILAGDIYKRVAPGEALDPKRSALASGLAFYPDDELVYAYGAQGRSGIASFERGISVAIRTGAIRVASLATAHVRRHW